ncbi:iron uptake system protein EfeO [Streptococcus oricebi]|uniref:EfeM/EfeO family lipoprotein n=1 Tax=Streptococcus oricebi TaxID=1547447 RepID=A0ABS5B1J3_9STRE|nr:iron uptake system protein EfeO [Streptococcus oricebi]MBP2622353.1 EfeM/EfeO family lipoprotein [Streptococcus oricebi]
MKKLGIILFSATLLLTACASNNKSNQTGSSSEAKVSLTAAEKKELQKATADYKAFVQEQIDKLLVDTESFVKLLKEGKLEEAKAAYPLARMTYERSEPIAESFKEEDEKIDSRLVDYKAEHKTEDGWSGFHRLEKIMWEENTTEGTEVYADQLVNDVKALKAKVATVKVTPELMLTGAVDLLNEVADTKITGEEEFYSHTDLYDFRANIEGAEKIYQLFKPLIEKKNAQLAKDLTKDFKEVNDQLDKYMTDKENYKFYTELTEKDTKSLATSVHNLGESLGKMGVILDGEK